MDIRHGSSCRPCQVDGRDVDRVRERWTAGRPSSWWAERSTTARRTRRSSRSWPLFNADRGILGGLVPVDDERAGAQVIRSTRLTTMVRITEPMIIALHGTNTRTRRSCPRASSAFGDVSSARPRATRSPALGNARSPTFRSTVSTTERTTETTSQRMVPGSRSGGAPKPRRWTTEAAPLEPAATPPRTAAAAGRPACVGSACPRARCA
jgi:hypothetical protein